MDERLWVEQRRFVLRHLREFGFGRTSMATIIEDESLKLVEHFKKLLRTSCDHRISDFRKPINNNNVGQIYKLQKDLNMQEKLKIDEFDIKEDKIFNHKLSTVADMYVKAEDYAEIRKISQSPGIIIPMHGAFGVTVLNTLWKMMAGRRFGPLFPRLSLLL